MELKLVYYPDPRLHEAAKPVEKGEWKEVVELVPRMFEIMRQSRGIGLAGPQIGCGKRIVVASILYEGEEEPREEVYVNPVIVARKGRKREEEGCLSLPGLLTLIDRYEQVTAEYETQEGASKRVEVCGLHAKLFQHEIDHLDGILIVDKMSPADRKQWAPLLRELEEDFASRRERNRRTESRAAL